MSDLPKEPVTAYDFANRDQSGYHFGVGDTANGLRALAARIEARACVIEKVHVNTISDGNEFTRSVLVIRFSEAIALRD